MSRYPILLLGLGGLAACAAGPRAAGELRRCIWVDRWDYATAADIDRIMADCHASGFTAVMFQVRGNGTVSFPSRNEVWSERFGFHSPGFDPLATAVAAAHRNGLELHAWVNVLPGWSGTEPPADARQLWLTRREWFLHSAAGEYQRPAAGRYLALNPCLPEVRRYLADLCAEIATSYPVDGLHLDYIRFPDDPGEDLGALGTDARTLSLFTGATGRATGDRDALHAWQTRCVSELVAEIRAATRVPGRRVRLTAAVFADAAIAREKVRQDWPAWAQAGFVDAVLPMNYTADDGVFAARVADAVALSKRTPVIAGVGLYRHGDTDQTVRQLDAALARGAAGVAVFNYRSLFGKPDGKGPTPEERRRRVASWLLTTGSVD